MKHYAVKTIVTSYLDYLNTLNKTDYIENIIFDFLKVFKNDINLYE